MGRTCLKLAATATLLIVCLFSTALGESDYLATLQIQHNVGENGQFVPRGNLEFLASSKQKKIQVKFLTPEYKFSEAEVKGFQKLVDKNARYTVHVLLEDERKLIASIPACKLWKDGFSEVFHFHVEKSGDMLGFEYAHFPAIDNECGSSADLRSGITLNTLTMASLPTEAFVIPKVIENVQADPSVPGIVTEESKSKSKSEKEGEEEAPQSFMRRYWYILLPIAVSFLIPADMVEDAAQSAAQSGAPAATSGKKRSKKSRG